MTHQIENYSIEIFWKWFEGASEDLSKDYTKSEIINEVSSRVDELGDFDWEIGPGILKENLFALSPKGNADMLKLTKKIIRQAPNIPKWEFYPAKPPKKWNYTFHLADKQNRKIDVNDWEYVLLMYTDSMIEILFRSSEIFDMEDIDKEKIVEIVLNNIVGEEFRMSHICGYEVFNHFPDEYISKSSSIKNLRNHLLKILKL